MSELKTIQVNASMTIGLYLNINVPVDVTEDDLSELIRFYELVDGSNMSTHEDWGPSDGDWAWEYEYEIEFDPKAPDFTEDIKKLLKENNDE